jgi:hypothetical protein
MHLAEHVDSIAENLVAFELRFCPVGRGLFNFERMTVLEVMARSLTTSWNMSLVSPLSISNGRIWWIMSLNTSPKYMAFSMPKPKSTVNFNPGSPEAALIPSLSLNSNTRKPSKPAFFSAKRYSASYMPKRHGPHEPAVKKT